MESSSEPAQAVSDQTDSALLQLDIAEYQALTNRCNYWITVQVSLLPLFFLVVGICVQMWSASPARDFLLWSGLLALQIIAMTWLHTGQEIYSAVQYMECDLRPRVGMSTANSLKFWRYESFLAKKRGRGSRWDDYGMLGLSILAFLTLIWFRRLEMSTWDYAGLIVNLAGLVGILLQTAGIVRTRRKFSICVMNLETQGIDIPKVPRKG